MQKICETEIDDPLWAESHWISIESNYRQTPHFHRVASRLQPFDALFMPRNPDRLVPS